MNKPFSWYGGKHYLLKVLETMVPTGGAPYCEPYCGSAALLFHRRPAPVEVLNDLDGNVVNFFRVLQSGGYYDLVKRLEFTPYALDEFRLAIQTLRNSDNAVDRAWAFFVVQNQIHSGSPAWRAVDGNWSRAVTVSRRKMAAVCSRWKTHVKNLDSFRRRLMRVQIDKIDAIKCIERYDSPKAVFYIDPPYPLETRSESARKMYNYESTDDNLKRLCSVLLDIRGMAVLSTYWSDIWQPLLDNGWIRTDIDLHCRAGSYETGRDYKRVECILKNPACFGANKKKENNKTRQLTMFGL